MAATEIADGVASTLAQYRALAAASRPIAVHGRLVRVAGLVLEATGLRLPIGSVCLIEQAGATETHSIEAEVVGFDDDRLYLMPTGHLIGLTPGALVTPVEIPVRRPRPGGGSHPWRRSTDRMRHLPIGDGLLGRVVDAGGRPLDRLGPLRDVAPEPIQRRPIDAMEREPVRMPMDTGVRAIDAILTVGRGQRVGLFASAGVGKSVLLGMMARYTDAEIIVVGLIGERGREVKEFIEDILGESGLARAVVVAAPADTPPLLRLQGAAYATAVAEHFRSQGRHVLLLLDSLTRYAMAAREVALAIGEPPATKGYPPSVFARLPQLVERAGNGRNGHGSITAFYTVLTDGDALADPIGEAARSFLDGHFVLSHALADSGHYPAIDIEQSISRVMHNVTDARHQRLARQAKSLWARYQRSRDLISVGAYASGSDPEIDRAIALHAPLCTLLQQPMNERSSLPAARAALEAVVGDQVPQ